MSINKNVRNIILSILFAIAVAALATFFTDTSSSWYTSLALPAFQPPAIVFSIVWTILYILMAISLSLYTTTDGFNRTTVLVYIFNGLLNPLWTYVFFTRQNPLGAFFILILLFFVAINLYKRVSAQNKTAAYLLLPYIFWLGFAMYLNYEITFLN